MPNYFAEVVRTVGENINAADSTVQITASFCACTSSYCDRGSSIYIHVFIGDLDADGISLAGIVRAAKCQLSALYPLMVGANREEGWKVEMRRLWVKPVVQRSNPVGRKGGGG